VTVTGLNSSYSATTNFTDALSLSNATDDDRTLCILTDQIFTLNGNPTGILWQVSTDDINFTNISLSDPTYLNANTKSLTVVASNLDLSTYSTYYYRASGPKSSGGLEYSESVAIIVKKPTTSNAGPDQTGAATCGLTTVNLAANAPSVGTGAWSIVSGTGGSFGDASSPTSTFTGTAGVQYELKWTISNSPCTASEDNVLIKFNQNPTIADAGPDQVVSTTTATLAGNLPTVGTGTWAVISGGATVTTPGSRNSGVTNLGAGLNVFRWTITNAPCTESFDEVSIYRTVTSITVDPTSQEYSDKVTYIATVNSGSMPGAPTLVDFYVGTEIVGKDVPVINGVATLTNDPLIEDPTFKNVNGFGNQWLLAPDYKVLTTQTVSADFKGETPAFPVVNPTTTLTIDPEYARVTYTGQVFVTASSSTATSCNVVLSATIQDITAINNISDPDAGDIRNAKVSFVIRDASNNIVKTVPATVGLVSSNDIKTGTFSATTSLSVPSITAGTTYTVQIVVGGYYTADALSELNNSLTVRLPGTEMVNGGGYIKLPSTTAGVYAGDANSKANFGFTVKYNKKKTTVQGQFNMIVRKTLQGGSVKVYQIKGNNLTSLTANGPANPGVLTPATATFFGKASINDVTDPNMPVAVSGANTIRVDVTDRGEPGSADDIAVLVNDKNGGLSFSSDWNGTKTVEEVLTGGNIVVSTGGSSATVGTTSTTNSLPSMATASMVVDNVGAIEAKIFPNPSFNVFNLTFTGGTKEKLDVTVMDVSGRTVKSYKVDPVGTFRFGDGLRPGMYMIQVKQGQTNRVFKVIKQ
jgi:hypothetical protein